MSLQVRCIEEAHKRLKHEKKAKTVLEWVKTANKRTNRVNTIDLLQLLAKLDRKQCNEPVIYDTILDVFSGPQSKDEKSLYQRAKRVTMTCLADPVFKQDFSDELGSTPGSYRYDAVCDVLKSAKLNKTCGKT